MCHPQHNIDPNTHSRFGVQSCAHQYSEPLLRLPTEHSLVHHHQRGHTKIYDKYVGDAHYDDMRTVVDASWGISDDWLGVSHLQCAYLLLLMIVHLCGRWTACLALYWWGGTILTSAEVWAVLDASPSVRISFNTSRYGFHRRSSLPEHNASHALMVFMNCAQPRTRWYNTTSGQKRLRPWSCWWKHDPFQICPQHRARQVHVP